MEEEVDYILSNNTNSTDETLRTLYYAQEAIVFIFCIIGIIADGFIIHIIARNEKMRTRTNILILNLALNDALFLLGTPAFVTGVLQLIGIFPRHMFDCFVNHLEATSQLIALVIIAAIISDTVIQTKKVSTRVIIAIIYSLMFALTVMNTLLCGFRLNWPILYLIVGFFIIILFVAMISKEIAICFKRKTNPAGERAMIRMNIGRIFVYIWFGSCMLLVAASPFIVNRIFGIIFEYIFIFGYLCSLYILAYLACADKFFKICLLNIFRRKENKYNIDATITFADETNETGFENPAVNISFNEQAQKVTQT